MAAELSIVIPTLNAEERLPACLSALVEGVMSGLIRELIISDGGSQDATLEIAEDAGARLVQGAASRGGQLQRGVAMATGGWVLVLHADTVLEAGWSGIVSAHIDAGGAPAYFRLRFDRRGFGPTWIAGWANLRSRLFALPYGDQGLLVSQADYAQAGGYPDQPLMEDVHLVRALGRSLKGSPVRAVTSFDRYQTGWVRRGGRNLWTLVRYLAGADPARLAVSYNQSRARNF